MPVTQITRNVAGAAIRLADLLLGQAVRILYSQFDGTDYPEVFVRDLAGRRLTESLYQLRQAEPADRRAVLLSSVNRLRADAGRPAVTWPELLDAARRPGEWEHQAAVRSVGERRQ